MDWSRKITGEEWDGVLGEKDLADFLVAALWATLDISEGGEGENPHLDEGYSLGDLSRGAVQGARLTLGKFKAAARETWGRGEEYDGIPWEGIVGGCRGKTSLGHDLLLTMNGHGAGFWDGDWPAPWGARFAVVAIPLGEYNLEAGDDGVVHWDREDTLGGDGEPGGEE